MLNPGSIPAGRVHEIGISELTTPKSSVSDPFHFDMDPDPFREITDPTDFLSNLPFNVWSPCFSLKQWYISINMEECTVIKQWSDDVTKIHINQEQSPLKVLQIKFYAFILLVTPSVFITVFSLILVLIYHGFREKQVDQTLKGWYDKKSVLSKTKAH